MLGAVLLVVPAAMKWMPVLTPLAAAVLALETLALAGVSARYSLKLTAANPMVWALVMGLLAAFVAYGRYALRPPACPPARRAGRPARGVASQAVETHVFDEPMIGSPTTSSG